MRDGASTSTGPSGRPQIARTSCSNWLVAQASIVQCPELCGRGAISLASTLPFNAGLALKLLYKTVDAMWYAAGDTSTDFNFYTKRATLAGVYSSTLLYWLNDRSAGGEATWGFLDRRIDDVMKIEKLKSQVKSWTGGTTRTASRR